MYITVAPKASWADLICHPHKHYTHRQWLQQLRYVSCLQVNNL